MPQVQLPQGTISYADRGSGPPVVLLHGLLVDGRLWRGVVPELEGAHRVVVPELPLGSHTTPVDRDADLTPRGLARLVADLLDALDLTDVTLVGNDTGGAIAQLVAADHPARVGRLVLTSCDLLDVFPPPLFRPLLLAARVPGALAGIGALLRRVPALRSTPPAYGWLTKRPIPREVLDAWVAPGADPAIRHDLRKVLAGIDPAETRRAAEQLRAFDRPVLLAWGEEDRFFSVDLARRLAASLRDARVELVHDSATFTPEDQPVALARLVADFTPKPAAARTS